MKRSGPGHPGETIHEPTWTPIMAHSPLRTRVLRDGVVWSATRRRRRAESEGVKNGSITPPATVNDGSDATPAGGRET